MLTLTFDLAEFEGRWRRRLVVEDLLLATEKVHPVVAKLPLTLAIPVVKLKYTDLCLQ